MGQTITIGGDRLGSGAGMQTELNDYGRSTHNLREKFTSTLAPGVLIPFYNNIGLDGDTFDIDLQAMMRTIPTKGPLFGSFKLQMDMFCIPIRLYNAILHNNPVNIGMNMKHVKLPKIHITVRDDMNPENEAYEFSQIHPNSLLKYLGISGIGHATQWNDSTKNVINRFFNGVGAIGYYDVVKNYYANKQENKFFTISHKLKLMPSGIFNSVRYTGKGEQITTKLKNVSSFEIEYDIDYPSGNRIYVQLGNNATKNDIKATDIENGTDVPFTTEKIANEIVIKLQPKNNGKILISLREIQTPILTLEEYPLEQIDECRMNILSLNSLTNNEYVIDEQDTRTTPDYLRDLVATDEKGHLHTRYPMHGLALKTYQSDLYNNWLDSELIDGENGIAAITTIDTSDGLKMDALLLAQKVYNMLNKIVAHGNTYEDWRESVYGVKAVRRAETPIYIGGMSSEIVFDEVVSAAATADSDLGALAGRGNLSGKKGGNMVIKVTEPSYIMGIVSITPRINYSQGNAWYNTELDSIDDLHKPALDGIGFQNLMGEQLAWWAVNHDTEEGMQRDVVGKIPSWMNYMTAIDKCFGEFADNRKIGYMVLKRDYSIEVTSGTGNKQHTHIGDLTTYIDPSKFNYAFAYDQLDAQNFWCQIMTNVVARRVMSAKLIPNL